MKTILSFATLVACLSSFSLTPLAQGQGQPQQSAGSVAVIDISKIFKEHKRFRASLEDMKKDVEVAENNLRHEGDTIKKMVQQLKDGPFTPGSPQYKAKEEEIAKKQADVQLQMNSQKRDFMQREAQVYYNVYKEIEQEVKYFAQRHGINLVLRFNNIDMKPHERQGVLAGVNRAVVYQNNIDITYDILQRINPPEREANVNPTNRNQPQFPRSR